MKYLKEYNEWNPFVALNRDDAYDYAISGIEIPSKTEEVISQMKIEGCEIVTKGKSHFYIRNDQLDYTVVPSLDINLIKERKNKINFPFYEKVFYDVFCIKTFYIDDDWYICEVFKFKGDSPKDLEFDDSDNRFSHDEVYKCDSIDGLKIFVKEVSTWF